AGPRQPARPSGGTDRGRRGRLPAAARSGNSLRSATAVRPVRRRRVTAGGAARPLGGQRDLSGPGGPSRPDRGPHRRPAQPRHRGPELFDLAGEFCDAAAALARVTRLGDLADPADFLIERTETTFARPGMGSGAAGRVTIWHRRPAMRAAGCFAHIGERYAWQ